MSVSVEICVASIDGALAAARGGADRIELNSGLALGGVTPSIGLARKVVTEVDIPVISMLRPRESGFNYSENEFDVMRRDLDALLEAGVAGIAFGVLTADGSVDTARCERLISQMGDREPVFHRAFDVVKDADAALQSLMDLGVKRVMTSGLAATAAEGSDRIRELIQVAGDSVGILAAGGVRSHNVAQLIAKTGCQHVHAALLKTETDSSVITDIAFSSQRSDGEHLYSTTDGNAVAEFVSAVRN